MARGLWWGPARFAAAVVGGVLPMLTVGMVHADLPGPPPLPPLPSIGQPITLIVEPPSLATVPVRVDPNGCVSEMSYDNTQAAPPGTIYRGQSACGSGVYAPILHGQATLTDAFGNVVSTAPAFAQRGIGPYTSQGELGVATSAPLPGSSPGAVPGLDYTITYNTAITLVWPQYWGPAPQGCVTRGQTMVCTAQTTYNYIPGTQGGFVPS